MEKLNLLTLEHIICPIECFKVLQKHSSIHCLTEVVHSQIKISCINFPPVNLHALLALRSVLTRSSWQQ